MSTRPQYPTATILERTAHVVLAAVAGIGVLVAVVAAFHSQVPDALPGSTVVASAEAASR